MNYSVSTESISIRGNWMRTPYQKEKLLKILELLLHETDENHPMNASEISNRLRSDLGEEYVVDRNQNHNQTGPDWAQLVAEHIVRDGRDHGRLQTIKYSCTE